MSQSSTKATTEVDRIVGARICALRKAKGVSQTDLGRAVGVTFQQVQKYEKGQNRVGAGRLRAIAELLEVPVATFFEETGEAYGLCEESPLAHLMLPGASDMLRFYAALPADGRQAILSATRGIALAFSRTPELVS